MGSTLIDDYTWVAFQEGKWAAPKGPQERTMPAWVGFRANVSNALPTAVKRANPNHLKP